METTFWVVFLIWAIIIPLIYLISGYLKSEKKDIILLKWEGAVSFSGAFIIWLIEHYSSDAVLVKPSFFSLALLFSISIIGVFILRYGGYLVNKIEQIEKQIKDNNKEK